MQWAFVMIVVTIVLIPGLDLLMTLRNAAAGGRRVGLATVAGIGLGCSLQAILVSIGVGAVIVKVQPLFLAIKWAGIVYLAYLGIQGLRAARRGTYEHAVPDAQGNARRAFRQGLLCDVTNPKIIVFFLMLLPQFVSPGAPLTVWLAHALLLPFLGTVWLIPVTLAVSAVRRFLLRRPVRRGVDGIVGLILVGMGVSLALET